MSNKKLGDFLKKTTVTEGCDEIELRVDVVYIEVLKENEGDLP